MSRPSGVLARPCWPGLDEAGRGAWAGPVCAAAVILTPGDVTLPDRWKGVRDSKQMTARQREYWAAVIQAEAFAWAIGWATCVEIDGCNIYQATRLAMQRAQAGLPCLPEHLLIDAMRLPALTIQQTALIKGDSRSLSIAAASVLAKTARDAAMCALDEDYPGYGFAVHKGYGTRLHQNALQQWGPCPVHRFSYKPVQALAAA